MTGNSAMRSGHDAAIKVTKAVHILAWFSVESCVLYLVYTGFAGRSGRRAAIAAGVVAGESLVFAANGFSCPLTDIAEHLGADHGSVTDAYLPARLAHNLPAIHAPLLLMAAYLHRRNMRRGYPYSPGGRAGSGMRASATAPATDNRRSSVP